MVYLVTTLLQIFHRMWKNFENRSIFGDDMDKNLRLTFWPPCIRTAGATAHQSRTTYDWSELGLNRLITMTNKVSVKMFAGNSILTPCNLLLNKKITWNILPRLHHRRRCNKGLAGEFSTTFARGQHHWARTCHTIWNHSLGGGTVDADTVNVRLLGSSSSLCSLRRCIVFASSVSTGI